MDYNPVKKILILDFSRIGDTLMHEPALRALKLRFPEARFYALTDRPNIDLLRHHPAIVEARVFPRVRNIKTLIAFIRGFRWIRKQKFDLLINFYMGGASPIIGRRSNIPLRVSFDKTPALCRAYNILVPAPSGDSNWIVETNEILRPFGIDPASVSPQVKFFVSDENRSWTKTVLPHEAIAVYQLAASEPAKCWPVPRFALLAEKLYRDRNLIPVVIGSPDQIARTDAFFQYYPASLPSIRLPVLSLDKIAAVIEQADILISGDTGVMHLGFGVETPTLGLFSNRPEFVVSATTRKMILFQEDESLPKFKSGQLRGNMGFTVEEVFEAAMQLIAGRHEWN